MPPSVLLVKSLSPMTPENRDNGKLRGWQNTHHRGMSRGVGGAGVSGAPFSWNCKGRAGTQLSRKPAECCGGHSGDTREGGGILRAPVRRSLEGSQSPACLYLEGL